MSAFAEGLPRNAGSVATARRLVEIHGIGLGASQLEDAGLMTSELVTNALVHGSGRITISITAAARDVTITVSDDGDGPVALVPFGGPAGGWGLRVVDQLSDAWGVQSGSTRVWFRMQIRPRLL